MPQCKKSNCREEAVKVGKRYCPKHLTEYKAKQAEYEKRQRALPDCEARRSIDCSGKVNPQRARDGHTICANCASVLEEEDRQAAHERWKWEQFETASTVEELKEWMREYLLNS